MRLPLPALTALAFLAPASLAFAAPTAGSEDTFAPLQRYAGAWTVQSSLGKIDHLQNRCARAGDSFVCEQVLNGKSAAIVVFQLEGEVGGWRTYRVRAIPTGAKPGAWNHLTIEGERWVYAGQVDGHPNHPLRARTINEFSGPDHIHFETQTSRDGRVWTATHSGDETRETPAH